MVAAKWLGVPVPDIVDVPLPLIYKALDYMSAEVEAEKEIAERNSRKR